MPRASSTSGKKKCFSGCYLPSLFHHFCGGKVTWQIQLIWLSFAFIFSSFCRGNNDTADSAYLVVICLHLFSILLGEEWHGRFSLSGCPFVFIFSSFLWRKKVTWQFQLFWLSFAIICSPFCGRKTDMTDSGWI